MTAIYLKHNSDLVPMDEQPYDAETVLQQLLEDHPALLAGGQGEGEANWLLIQREAAVPDVADGGGRWSMDHLFVDRDGVPTLVEVKRSTDTRTRREVVAQMLDYAANSSAHWPDNHLRATFEARVGVDAAAEQVASLLGHDEADEVRIDAFWEGVAQHLREQRLRLVFVADTIPAELRRIVEFLNEQMTQTDVLALEVKQYVERTDASGGEPGRTILVPRVIGDTSRAEATKGRSSTPQSAATGDAQHRFWAALLATAEPGHPHSNVAPSRDNWIQAGAGVSGSSFKYRVRADGASVELTIESPDRAANERRFDALHAQRDAIEQAFGAPLQWDRKPGLRRSVVLAHTWDAGRTDESRWPELHADMTATMARFVAAIRPALMASD